MHDVVTLIASSEAASPGLFQALGIDWKLLLEQGLAFLVLVLILAKFVYPALMKSVDDRRMQIETSMKEAKESHDALEKAEAKVDEILEQSRKDADDIMARAQQEAAAIVANAESKANVRAEQIVTEARAQLGMDIAKAREELKRDTIELVALATERVIGEKLDERKDADLVKKALAGERA